MVDMEFDEKTIDKWLDTGILEDIPDAHVNMVIKSMEDLYDYFMSKVGLVIFPDQLDSWCFPMLRKILKETDYKEINVKELVFFSMRIMRSDEFISKRNELRPLMYNAIDVESYLIDYIGDEYLKNIKDENI